MAAAPAHAGGFSGFLSGLWDSTGKPLIHMVEHPVETAKGIGHAAVHPIATGHAIASAVSSTTSKVMSGDPYAMGTALGTVGMLAVPGAGEAEGVEDAARLGQIGELGEVADASKTASVAATTAGTADVDRGVAFFGKDNLDSYYSGDKVLVGAPNGKPFFLMPEQDATLVRNSADAARYTGMAPSAARAYTSGGDIYGLNFPTEGMDVRVPTAADADGWPHFLEGGQTAVSTGTGDNAGYLLNPTREFVVPGGTPAPPGSYLFKLGEDGSWEKIREF